MKIEMMRLAVLSAILSFTALADDTEKTCNLWQVCNNHSDLSPGEYPTTPCANGGDVFYPSFVEGNFAPTEMQSIGTSLSAM